MSCVLSFSKPKGLTVHSYCMGMSPVESVEFYWYKNDKLYELIVPHQKILNLALEILRGEKRIVKYMNFEELKIELRDFLFLVEYILNNTDLRKPIGSDPRVKFVEDIRDGVMSKDARLNDFARKIINASIVNGYNTTQWKLQLG